MQIHTREPLSGPKQIPYVSLHLSHQVVFQGLLECGSLMLTPSGQAIQCHLSVIDSTTLWLLVQLEVYTEKAEASTAADSPCPDRVVYLW